MPTQANKDGPQAAQPTEARSAYIIPAVNAGGAQEQPAAPVTAGAGLAHPTTTALSEALALAFTRNSSIIGVTAATTLADAPRVAPPPDHAIRAPPPTHSLES